MVEVNWTDAALNDIENIAEYIAKDSAKYAARQIIKFFNASQILEQSAFNGRMVPEVGRKNIRELIVGNYRMVYRVVNKSRVDFLSVHHGARLLENAMRGRIRFKKK